MTTAPENDDTRRILDMLSQGKITVDQADQLLKALNGRQAADARPAGAGRDAAPPRWMRINIQRTAQGDDKRRKDVNIRVPIALAKGGMRLGALIATAAGEKAAQRIKARGVDIDLSAINRDLSQMNGVEFDEFIRGLNDANIEIDDGKAQVRITTE